jgi:hypothetical protein
VTSRRYEVFTYRSGDTVFSTRFRFVAQVVARFVGTLDYDHPIPLMPVPCELGPQPLGFPDNPIFWCPDCQAGACPGLQIGQCYVEGCAHDCNQDEHENDPEGQEEHEYDARICPDCDHDYLHDELGRCLYPLSDRVCGWHPDVVGPVPCGSRVETSASLNAIRIGEEYDAEVDACSDFGHECPA